MNIKVSGITSMKQLQQLDGLDVDFAGLIFDKKSPCYIADKFPKKELKNADLDIKLVGIFNNAEYDEIMTAAEGYGIEIIQLNGDESPHLCEKISNEFELIKTFHIDSSSDRSLDYMLQDYDEVCDYYLFNNATGNADGDSQEKFDWSKISKGKIEKPFFISGGIEPTDAPLIKKFRHPDFYGIDVNTHFEKTSSVKDLALLLKFTRELK